jgi:iron complex outermembrane receptor protein
VIDENDFSATAGVKGKDLMGWAWDLSTTYGKDDDSVSVVNTLNPTLGPTSPHAFYAGSWINTELTTNLDFTRSFEIGLAAPLATAFGLEHRNNSYALKPGEPGSYELGAFTDQLGPDPSNPGQSTDYQLTPGAQAFKGFSPEIASNDYRDSFAAYFDFETKPIKALDVGIAARYEHYDDFGSTTTGKLSLRYEITRNYALRGTVSNGFRAPALGQSHYAATSTQFQQVNNKLEAFQVGTFPIESAVSQAFGASPLRPEKSTNYSVGFVATPIKAMDVTVDLYRIYVRHRIEETGTIGAPSFPLDDPNNPGNDYLTDLLLGAGLDPTSAAGTTVQYFTNAIDTRTQGIDFVSGYRSNFGRFGTVRWSVEANFNQTDVTAVAGVPAVLQPIQQAYPTFALVDGPVQGYLTEATPRNKLILGAAWRKGKWHANLRENRFGHIVDTNAEEIGGPVQFVKPMWTTDLDLSWDATDRFTFAVGATNLFNSYPPETTPDYQSAEGQGFGKYDPLTPAGYFGGFYYGRVAYHF